MSMASPRGAIQAQSGEALLHGVRCGLKLGEQSIHRDVLARKGPAAELLEERHDLKGAQSFWAAEVEGGAFGRGVA